MSAQNRIEPAILARPDRVLRATIAAGLMPVVDEHNSKICQVQTESCLAKLKSFSTRLSARYAGQFPEAVFEILNEPGGNMPIATWSGLVADCLRVIRRTNLYRTLIVAALNVDGPLVEQLPEVPERDLNLILTVHYYRPMAFTHQDAPWSEFGQSRNDDWGSPEDEARVTADFAEAVDWTQAAKRPVYRGEFGVYDRAPSVVRARYAGFLARTAERHGWPWAH